MGEEGCVRGGLASVLLGLILGNDEDFFEQKVTEGDHWRDVPAQRDPIPRKSFATGFPLKYRGR